MEIWFDFRKLEQIYWLLMDMWSVTSISEQKLFRVTINHMYVGSHMYVIFMQIILNFQNFANFKYLTEIIITKLL